MARIVLFNGQEYRGGDLPAGRRTACRPIIYRDVLLEELARMRTSWEKATGGNMESVTINLGMLFDDLAYLITGQDLNKTMQFSAGQGKITAILDDDGMLAVTDWQPTNQ